MNKITQTMRFRQAVIEYSNKHGVTAAAIRYHLNRQYIYRWRNRYDGTLQSLADRSHRPHSHPNQHTAEEIKLILDMRHRNPNAGIVVFWVKLRQQGYTRSISGLYRFLRKRGANIKLSASKESLRRPQANAGCRKAREARIPAMPIENSVWMWTISGRNSSTSFLRVPLNGEETPFLRLCFGKKTFFRFSFS